MLLFGLCITFTESRALISSGSFLYWFSTDLKQCMRDHDNGSNRSAAAFRSWELRKRSEAC